MGARARVRERGLPHAHGRAPLRQLQVAQVPAQVRALLVACRVNFLFDLSTTCFYLLGCAMHAVQQIKQMAGSVTGHHVCGLALRPLMTALKKSAEESLGGCTEPSQSRRDYLTPSVFPEAGARTCGPNCDTVSDSAHPQRVSRSGVGARLEISSHSPLRTPALVRRAGV